jgi:putative spermidine/putrescine transport system ATP-binding protein
MRGELRRTQEELGITFVHVTHTQLEAIAVADMVVVMTQGRIEQAGTAREIYTRPHSAYVARFMGGHNVFSGRLAAVANGYARLLGDSGEPYVVPLPPSSMGQQPVVWFAVRRDCIELAHAAQDGALAPTAPNTLCGTLQAIEYQGSYVKVTIHRAARTELIAHVSDRHFFPLHVQKGDRIVARWAVEDAHVLGAVGEGPYEADVSGQVSRP